MPAPFALLGAARITAIINALQDPRLLPPELIWRNRIPVVPANDDELLATFNGQLLIADLVADDARAVTYSMGEFRYQSTKIPNIKMGISMNQTMLNAIQRIAAGFGTPDDLGIFTDWENRTVQAVLNGVELRRELLLTAMLNDGLTYDRLGIKMNNVTFGMPTNLKVTAGTGWDNVAATPITDIQTVRRLARVMYGINYNRLTASSAALYYATQTTEFQNQARTYGWGFGGIPMPAAPVQSDSMLIQMLQRIIGGGEAGQGNAGNFTIEVDDRRFWSQDNNGLITSAPFQPVNRVLLTDSRNDGNAAVMDLANSIPTESIVASVAQNIGIIGDFNGPARGPIAYVTATHNSPSLTYWGVARSFPRKHMKQASASLNVGSFVDPIPLNVPPV